MLWGATGILLLLGVLYALLLTPYVQTSLVQYITSRVERETGVKIEVGGVDFRPIRSLVLKDVLLRDFKKDTLLYCEDLRVKADSFNFVRKSFTIREVVLNNTCFHLWISRASDGSMTNLEMFLDSLQRTPVQQEESPETAGPESNWLVGLKKISISNSHFTYQEEEHEPVDYGVNWTDIDCREWNVELTDFDFSEDYTAMTVSGLSFVEKSGLRMKDLGGRVLVKSDNLLVTDAHIDLERSHVDLVKLEFGWTPDQHDWKYFTRRIQQYYELGPSSVSFIDLAYFNGILRGIRNTVKCSGIVTNTIDHLQGQDLYFELGEKSVFQGSFRSSGLPDVWNTDFHIEMHRAHLNPKDLASVYLPWFQMNIPVPSLLYGLEYVDFEKIRFDGKLSDFILQAKSITPALAGDLTFAYYPCDTIAEDCSLLRGDFRFDRIDGGRFTGLTWLGGGSISGSYSGKWDSQGPAMNLKSRIHRLRVQQGHLKNVDVFLTWETDHLNLMASLENPEIRGGIVLNTATGDSLDFISAKGKIQIDDLNSLGISCFAGHEKIEGDFDLVHAGKGKRSFTNAVLSGLSYSNSAGTFTIDTVSIEDNRIEQHNVTTLKSDVADISLDGNYREVQPALLATQLLRNYLPAYAGKKLMKSQQEKLENVDFRYGMEIKDANRILKVLYPELSLSPGTKLFSHFHYGDEQMDLTVLADTIRYQDISLFHSRIDMAGDEEEMKLFCRTEKLLYGEDYRLYNLRNEMTLVRNQVENKLTWCNWEDKTYSGELAALVLFQPQGQNRYKTEIRIHPGVVVMADSVWHVVESSILLDDREIQVNNFSVRKGGEYLSIRGKLSEDAKEKLSLDVNRFNLAYLARLTNAKTPFFGQMTGKLTVQDFYQDRLLFSDFNVDDWGIGSDTLGSLHLRSFWDVESRSLVLGAENRVEGSTPLTVAGYYVPATDTLNVDVKLEKVGLQRAGKYVAEYFSQLTGNISGNVNISGTSRLPDVSGFIYLDSVGMKINSLNTKFQISDRIRIQDNRLLFHNFKVHDIHHNSSVLNGTYNLWENKYSLNIRSDHFLLLNTDYSHNEILYGRVFLSGLTEIDNLEGIMNVTVNARTDEASRLFIPLTEDVTEQSQNFLHFVNANAPELRKMVLNPSYSDIHLNANLEVNDNLEVQVIFDPTVGDILKATGSGDIKVSFDKDGSLSMFGEYQISRGDYLFTLSNLVNKKFVLTPGGTITWSGSPYDAMLNINAVYNLKTSVSELLPIESTDTGETGQEETKTSDSNKKVPVECILNLSDNLNNPVVKFDINFPTLETQTKSYIQSLFSSQDEVNKQMFSLLVLNRFYRMDDTPMDYGNQAKNTGVTTFTEMLSNQLSRWLSQISNNIDIGVAYRPGNRDNELNTADELELALSTQLLNDRVTISANGNMDLGRTEDKKTNIAGDFDVDVKLNKQGTLKLKAYSHTDEKLIYNNTETIQGVGVSYQESFDTFRELLRKYFGFLRRNK